MSGIEIVGVLLGAFPLLISAFEHYRDLAQARRLLAEWEAESLKSLNEVKDEEVMFRQTATLLLWPLVHEDLVEKQELDMLVADPGGAGWQVENVEKALQDRLGDISGRYISIMQELQTSIFKMLQSLGFQRPRFQEKLAKKQGKSSFASKVVMSANAELLKRVDQVKFGLGKAARDEALAEIQTKNDKLEKLLRRCDKVARLQENEKLAVPRKASRSLLQYWRHAGRIYTLFQETWVCSCRSKHCAHLWLHHPKPNANELKMLIMWAPEALPADGTPLWRPQDLQISWLQGHKLQRSLQIATSGGSISATDLRVSPPREGIFKRARKRVKFEVPDNSTPPPRDSECVAAAAPIVVKSAKPSHLASSSMHDERDGLIRNLCKAMASCGITPQQLGALRDSAEGLEYLVCSQPNSRVVPAEVSLRELLDQRSRPLRRRSDRTQIALAIASAHLQLRSTPWARRQWEAKDILFPQDPQDPGKVAFRPYISADFNDALPTSEQQPKHTDRSFASLGIMLLELCFGVLLEQHEFWSKPGFEENQSDPDLRNMVAAKWADDVEGEAGPDFAAAVTWCLRESPTTLEGEKWRKDLADQVVMPLQHCWDCIKPKAAT